MRRVRFVFLVLVLGAVALLAAGTPSVDAISGTTERVSVDSAGNQGNGDSYPGASQVISADGRYVAFESFASNLVPSDTAWQFAVDLW